MIGIGKVRNENGPASVTERRKRLLVPGRQGGPSCRSVLGCRKCDRRLLRLQKSTWQGELWRRRKKIPRRSVEVKQWTRILLRRRQDDSSLLKGVQPILGVPHHGRNAGGSPRATTSTTGRSNPLHGESSRLNEETMRNAEEAMCRLSGGQAPRIAMAHYQSPDLKRLFRLMAITCSTELGKHSDRTAHRLLVTKLRLPNRPGPPETTPKMTMTPARSMMLDQLSKE
jgi:hypothetical protein